MSATCTGLEELSSSLSAVAPYSRRRGSGSWIMSAGAAWGADWQAGSQTGRQAGRWLKLPLLRAQHEGGC